MRESELGIQESFQKEVVIPFPIVHLTPSSKIGHTLQIHFQVGESALLGLGGVLKEGLNLYLALKT